MLAQILFGIILWLVATMVTPQKLRVFISALVAVLVGIFVAFLVLNPREPMVSVPSVGDQKAYDLPYNDYQALIATPSMPNAIKIPQAEELSKLGKTLLTAKDCNAEQLKALENLQGFSEFSSGRLAIIFRTVPATVREGKLVPSYQGLEFTVLPYYDELKLKEKSLETKSKVLDAIRQEVFKGDSK